MISKPTAKQLEFCKTSDKRINILQGSVRSGKTYSSLVKWALKVASYPQDSVFLMAGRTQTTLKRNCLLLLQSMVGWQNFTYSMSTKTGSLFGHTIFLEGADNERAEDKIRGLTLDGAYIDEASLVPESFFTMLLSRLSKDNAFVYATTNSDNPMHWLKVNYIDRAEKLDCAIWNFSLEDNTYLSKTYIENIKKEYTGVFYKRFILGQWVIADGLVFSAFNEERDFVPLQYNSEDYRETYIACDYGIENPMVYSLWSYHYKTNRWHCLKEYYYSGREKQRPKTDNELYEDLIEFAKGFTIQAVIIDPSATSFITLIERNKAFKVIKANNEVVQGISFVNTCFAQDKIRISNACVNAKKELYSYSWDTEKSKQQGKDIVVKQNDHWADSCRYFLNTIVKPKTALYGITNSYNKNR